MKTRFASPSFDVLPRWARALSLALLLDACGDGSGGDAPPVNGGGTSNGGVSATGGTSSSPGGSATSNAGGGNGAAGSSAAGQSSSGGSTSGGSFAGGSTNGGVTSGGSAASGSSTGGTATGGTATAGSSAGGSGGGGSSGEWFPCDAPTSTYDVVVTGSGSSWQVSGKSGATTTHADMAAALSAGYARLSPNRTTKETMLVKGDGSIDASAQLKLPSYIVLNLCGTINVTGTASGSDRSPLYARDRTDIDIPHARITGSPQYGMFFRSVSNIRLGQIYVDFNQASSGIGVRIDNNPSAGGAKVKNVRIDYVSAKNTGSHGIETYGVDQIEIGRLDGVDTGECGVLLNATTNAEVGVVHCENCAAGTGYAAFRIANDAGKIGDAWPAGNIHVGEVYARQGGRGVFSVSGSGGLTIDKLDLASTGNNAVLLQNCYNTTLAAVSGTIMNGSVLLSNDTTNTNNGTFAASQNVTLKNLQLSGGSVSEAWCDLGDRNNRAQNITGGSVDMCFD